MDKSSIEQKAKSNNAELVERVLFLEDALTLIRDVANISEGVEWYAFVADKALRGEDDNE